MIGKPKLLILTKPLMNEYLELFGKLYDVLQNDGELTHENKWPTSPMDMIKCLYKLDHEDQPYFQGMVDLFEGEPCRTYIYINDYDNPEKWVKHVKNNLIGGPVNENAKPGSFRRIVHDITGIEVAPHYKKKEPFDNGVHCSDSIKNGERECGILYEILFDV